MQKFSIHESRILGYRTLVLKPQDLLVALDLALHEGRPTYAQLAQRLHIGVGTAHTALASARAAQLVSASGEAIRPNLVEFLIHGARYTFYPVRTGPTRGVPTGAAQSVLTERLAGDRTPLVWPEPSGRVRGDGLKPIYSTVPLIVAEDPQLHVVLAALDLIRTGSARERSVAAEVIQERMASNS